MFRACVKICVEIKCIKSSPWPLDTVVVSDRGQGGCGERQIGRIKHYMNL